MNVKPVPDSVSLSAHGARRPEKPAPATAAATPESTPAPRAKHGSPPPLAPGLDLAALQETPHSNPAKAARAAIAENPALAGLPFGAIVSALARGLPLPTVETPPAVEETPPAAEETPPVEDPVVEPPPAETVLVEPEIPLLDPPLIDPLLLLEDVAQT